MLTGRAPARRIAIGAAVLALSAFVPVVTAAAPVAATDPIAYPDLISVIPTTEMGITHPTSTTKEFDYTHIVYNAGTGPLEVQPTNYNASTNLATGVQNLYSYDGSGNPTLASQHTATDQFFFHAAHGHYHFPLATFGLYAVNPDGSMGGAVAVSPKNGFCLGDDMRLDTTLPHSPATRGYDGSTCTNPSAVRGISSGWGDRYDHDDPGQSIDITGVPDGTYWFHSVVDPDNNFVESNKANNTTDVKVRISGDTVTPVNPLMSQGSFVFDQSFFVDGLGNLSTPAFNTSSPNELIVAIASARSPAPVQKAQINDNTGGALSWSLAGRANTQAGTAEVWTAKTSSTLTNAVITSSLQWTGWAQSLSVFAIKGASGVGAVTTGNGATGAPGVSVTTTKPGSWVMAIGETSDSGVNHVPAPGLTMVHQDADVNNHLGAWLEAPPAPTPAAGTQVNFADSYPTGMSWNEVGVELLAAPSTDVTPPVISNVNVTNIGPDRATINWKTDEVATSRVDYGLTTAFGQSTPQDPSLVTAHSQQITGLSPNTIYKYQVASSDGSGNGSTSGPFSFTTTPPRTTPPVFSNVHIVDLETDQVTVSWATDEPASSHVDYGVTNGYGTTTPTDANLVTTHFEIVTNLQPGTVYHYRVGGTDPYSNSGSSGDFTFQTLATAPLITASDPVAAQGHGTVQTAPFSTATANEMLVAFVASDGPAGPVQTVNITSSPALTWTLDQRANSVAGTSEIWHAIAPAPLVNATVTSTQDQSPYDQALTVVAFTGAIAIGSTAGGSNLTGVPSVTLSMLSPQSVVYAVGNDWDHATARTLPANQSIVSQWIDTGTGDTFWTQALNGDGGPVESDITMADTAPTTDRWNFSAAEIRRPIGITPPAPTAPAVSNVTVSNITSTTATVNWTTDQIATSQVPYGPTPSYGNSTTLDLTGLTSHSQTLTGLTPSTQYHYQVISANGVGSTASVDATFTTAPAIPPTTTTTTTTTVPPTTTTSTTSTTTTTTTSTTTTIAPTTTTTSTTSTTTTVPATTTTSTTIPPTTTTTVPAKLDQTITFNALANATVGDPPITLTATASSGLTVTFSTTSPACTVSATTLTIVGAGPCTVQADQSGNATYNPAPPVQQTFTISSPTTTTTTSTTTTIPPTTTSTTTTTVPPTTTTSTTSTTTSSTTSTTTTVPPTTTSTSTTTTSTTVPPTTTSTSTTTTSTTSTTTTVPATTTTSTTIPPTTTTTVPAKLDQTITFTAISGKTLGQAPFVLHATATSGLTVAFTSTTPATCKVKNATVTLAKAGKCTVRADQAGNGNYNAAPSVMQTFTIANAVVKQSASGYWMLGADGHVYAFGGAQNYGSATGGAVAMSARRDNRGYWVTDHAGTVRAFGAARAYGGHPALLAGEFVSTISGTPSGNGYWLFTNRGRAFAYGDAPFLGDLRNTHLNGPIIASVATPTGHGYYMVGNDGGVFGFGDAKFYGSTGNIKLNKPIVGISPTRDNRGYWLVASDGGVFGYGDAPFRGSLGNIHLNKPVNGLVAYGNGYIMVASDGGVFGFSNKKFVGSLASTPLPAPIISIAALN